MSDRIARALDGISSSQREQTIVLGTISQSLLDLLNSSNQQNRTIEATARTTDQLLVEMKEVRRSAANQADATASLVSDLRVANEQSRSLAQSVDTLSTMVTEVRNISERGRAPSVSILTFFASSFGNGFR